MSNGNKVGMAPLPQKKKEQVRLPKIQLTFEQVKQQIDANLGARPACPDAVIKAILKSDNPDVKILEVRKSLNKMAKTAGEGKYRVFHALSEDKVASLFVQMPNEFVQVIEAAGEWAGGYALVAIAEKFAPLFIKNSGLVIGSFKKMSKVAGEDPSWAYMLSNIDLDALGATEISNFARLCSNRRVAEYPNLFSDKRLGAINWLKDKDALEIKKLEDFLENNVSDLGSLRSASGYNGKTTESVRIAEGIFMNPAGRTDGLYTAGAQDCVILAAISRNPENEVAVIGLAHIDKDMPEESIRGFMSKARSYGKLDVYMISGDVFNALRVYAIAKEQGQIKFLQCDLDGTRTDALVVDRHGEVYYGYIDTGVVLEMPVWGVDSENFRTGVNGINIRHAP